MKILISYGHDYAELIRKIKRDLEARSHTVWLDEHGISAGDDWRQKIENAIRDSALVLAFLSEHSTRDNGVCADELKIAYSYGCPIRTVVLDEVAKQKIPPFLLHIQYLDLTELSKNTCERTQESYSSCFEKLIRMVEDGDYVQHKEIIDRLAVRLHPVLSMVARSAATSPEYYKRQWLDEYINSWTAEGSRLSAIIGFPGSGKSCYCAHSFYTPENICSVVFCKQFKGKRGVAKILKNIAYQLSVKLPTYAKRLSWILDNGDVDLAEASDFELFDILIDEPLGMEIDGAHLPVVIVLDGADELTENGSNPLTNLVAASVDHLPPFVHFILTTRNNPAVTRTLAGRKFVELLPEDKRISVDIYNYLANELKDHLPADRSAVTLRTLTEKCYGSFLYASLLTEAITSGAISVENTDKYPEKIYDFYYRWMNTLVPDENVFAEKYYPAFSILVAANAPVSQHIIMRALKWKNADKIKFVRLFRSFIIERKAFDGELTVELFHSSFRDWMSDESGIADKYYINPEDGLELYADSLYEAYKSGTLKKSEATWLISVLLRAGRHEQLLTVAQDEELLNDLVSYAEKCQMHIETYGVAVNLFESIQKLSDMDGENTYADRLMAAKIPYLEGVGEFSFGNLRRAAKLIAPAIENIRKLCADEEYFDALYVLGTSLDWIGDRPGSVERFRTLYDAAGLKKNNKYTVRALCGLIWNDHFNNSDEGATWLKKLCALEGLDTRERLTVDLVRARVMLSAGELVDSMELYLQTLDASEELLWGYDLGSVRNQMLMLEAIVACYDNGLYVRAIQTGEKIYSHLKGRGNLPECYCASWLSFSYLRAGMAEEGHRYLRLAEQLNCKSKRAIRSEWMTMHLMSLRTFYELESGNYLTTYERYKSAESLAEECDDAWVAGDACYSLLKLHFLFGIDMPESDINLYEAKLCEMAQKSRLPHLEFKSALVKILTGREKPDADILTLLIDRELPSVDVFSELCLCAGIAEHAQMADTAKQIRNAIAEKLTAFSAKNPDTLFKERKSIKIVCEKLKL